MNGQTVFFTEHFEDANLSARGWYDGVAATISTSEHAPVAGSTASLEHKWTAGAIWHGRAICTARNPKCPQCPLLPHGDFG